VIVGLLVLAVVNDTGEAVLIAAGVAISGCAGSRNQQPPPQATRGSTVNYAGGQGGV
jgi:hypothetical protein